jgi:DSF synthase
MQLKLTYRPRDPRDFPRWEFETLDFEYDPGSCSVWMYYKAEGPPCYTFQTLSDMADLRESLRLYFASDRRDVHPIRYFGMASRKAGVFSLGGDLAMFANAIRNGERHTLRAYAHACIDVVHGLATAFGLPLVTMSVVTGQALGGGMEAALAEDFLLAEASAKLGVPEVTFNTFPGMGAVSLLTRRLGSARAEEIIASGRIYSGQQMFELGVADLVAPEGQGQEAALRWMRRGGAHLHARRFAMATARRSCFPISYDELIRITDLWTDCSCEVMPQDIRHMERLVSAQKRMLAS